MILRPEFMMENPKSIFQVGDKVKKTIYVGYQFPGKDHFQTEQDIYGKILEIHDEYAYVKYKCHTMEGNEKLADLCLVSNAEWNFVFKR
jgi:hypothetical protein